MKQRKWSPNVDGYRREFVIGADLANSYGLTIHPTTGSLRGADGYQYKVLGVKRMAIEISGMGMRTRDFFVITGSQLIGSTTILSRGEKLVLENNKARIETPETKVHQTGTGLPFFSKQDCARRRHSRLLDRKTTGACLDDDGIVG